MNEPSNHLDEATQRMFDTLLAPIKKRMSLNVFQTKYLPFLSSEPIPEETVQAMIRSMEQKSGERHTVADLHANLLNEWLDDLGQNVGVGYIEVDVVDSEGNIVYVVPPLLDASEEVLINDVNITALTEQAINQSKVLPMLGVKFINQNILPHIRQPQLNPKYVEMWNRIYRYHNLPLISATGQRADLNPAPKNEDTIESFDDYGD